MDNCIAVTGNLLARIKIGHTDQFLMDNILSHPEHPSLLAVSDTLSKYQIENLPVKVDGHKLHKLPLPCIVQLSDHGGMFHVLAHYTEEESIYINDKGKEVSIPTEDFLTRWTGICLLAEANNLSGEPGIEKKLAEKRTMGALTWMGIFFFLFWGIRKFVDSSQSCCASSCLLSGYALLKKVEHCMVTVLLWYEVDKFNPT